MNWFPPSGSLKHAEYSVGKFSYTIMKTPSDPSMGVQLYYLIGQRPANARKKSAPGAQDIMIDEAARTKNTFLVAFDVPGARKAFCSFKNAQTAFNALKALTASRRLNTSYEIIGSKTPCRLYMDVEWVESEHGARDVHATLTLLLTELIAFLKSKFIVCARLCLDDFVISRSRNVTKKQSYHIYMWNRVYFANASSDLRAVMLAFFDYLVRQMIIAGRSELRVLFFDRLAVSSSTSYRGGGCIVDMMVYTDNRQMRLPGSVKIDAPDRMLVPYSLSSGKELIEDPMAMSFSDDWSRYLVTQVSEDDSLRVIPSSDQLEFIYGKSTPVSVNSSCQRALTAYFTGTAIRDAGKSLLMDSTDATSQKKRPSSGVVSDSKRVVISNPTGAVTMVTFRGKPLEDYMQTSNDAPSCSSSSSSPSAASPNIRSSLVNMLAELDNSLSAQ